MLVTVARAALLFVPIFLFACGGSEGELFDDGGSGGASETTNASSTTTGQGGAAAVCVDFGDACTACEVEACEESYCACYGEADCGLYAQCTFACPDGDLDCYQGCNSQYPAAITKAVLLNDCAAAACPVACQDYPLLTLDGCERCSYERCEPTMNACLAKPACTALLACLGGCSSSSCQDQCYAEHPAALPEGYAVGTCIQQQCGAECG